MQTHYLRPDLKTKTSEFLRTCVTQATGIEITPEGCGTRESNDGALELLVARTPERFQALVSDADASHYTANVYFSGYAKVYNAGQQSTIKEGNALMRITVNDNYATVKGTFQDRTEFISVTRIRALNNQYGFAVDTSSFMVTVNGFQANSLTNGNITTSYALEIKQADLNRIDYEHGPRRIRAVRDGGCSGNTDFSNGGGEKSLTHG
ncbi:MAG: hypothetical protein Q8Q33_02365 [Chlamydiota bacterium]|nr:hypothetical protein [Chlamydiota bacterium]